MSSATPTSSQIAHDLLMLGAVILRPDDPFTWASGMKAPIYCDNRLTMGDVTVRRRLAQGFQDLIHQHKLNPEIIAGTATAGIAHAAWLADLMELPMVYVRSKAKGHGRENLIEGSLPSASRVVVVEDTISTGGSSVAAVDALRAAGADVQAVLAIYSYGFEKAERAFVAAGVPYFALTDFDALVQAAADLKRISAEHLGVLRTWRTDPENWLPGS